MIRTRVAAAALALAFPLGAIATRVALGTAPALARSGLAQPLPVVDAWGSFGALCFTIFALAVAASAAASAVLTSSAPGPGRGDGPFVTLLAIAVLAGCAAWPVVFSSDAYAYAAYGELAARGFDPYAAVPSSVRGASIDAARIQWHGPFPPCVYGPAFVAFARGVWLATGSHGAGAPVLALRVLAALAFALSIPLVDAALGSLPAARRAALLRAYGLNPVALWSVAEGHNDAFVLLAAAIALLMARRGAAFAAGALVGLSAIVKAPGAVLAGAFALDALAVRRAPRGAIGAACGVAIAAAVALPPLEPALRAIGAHGRYAPSVSLQSTIGAGAAAFLALAVAAYGVARLVRGERSGIAWLGIAAVAALPNPYPWYALWLVPLALAGSPSRAAAALYGVTIFSVLRYLPDATGNMSLGALRILAPCALLPLVLLLAPARKKAFAAT